MLPGSGSVVGGRRFRVFEERSRLRASLRVSITGTVTWFRVPFKGFFKGFYFRVL